MRYARASPAVAAANGKIYAIGGDRISEVNFYRARWGIESSNRLLVNSPVVFRITMTEVECFDPLTNEWTECHQLPESRSEAGAVII